MGSGTSIGRVRGLGSAKEGTHHWLHQRLTAGSNFLLMLWFMVSLALLPTYDHAAVSAWLGSAWGAIPMLLLIASVLYHARLGLQVVIEDYSHAETRMVLMVLMYAFIIGVAATALFSILKLAFTAGAAS